MSDVIAFLESLGRRCTPYSKAEQAEAVATFEASTRAALAMRDSAALRQSLQVPIFMVCSVVAPEFDEPIPDEQPVAPDDVPADGEVRAA